MSSALSPIYAEGKESSVTAPCGDTRRNLEGECLILMWEASTSSLISLGWEAAFFARPGHLCTSHKLSQSFLPVGYEPALCFITRDLAADVSRGKCPKLEALGRELYRVHSMGTLGSLALVILIHGVLQWIGTKFSSWCNFTNVEWLF